MPCPESEAVPGSYWRSEILQLMFWLREEGFGDRVDVPLLERFLGVNASLDVRYLDRLVDKGFLERVGDRYQLSEAGAREGELEFTASFREFIRPTHGECGPESWCHDPHDAGCHLA